ncbi:MAG: RagB/SusD family nutrient uptake outer membrane protein [Bacteroidales bacterium]|jgi:hypothetical protein|nr:RagB/SusD family nutrient uptake outer membrane protein [Bacteroidota bacterium]NLN99163.1 RagB/SusD family nutrient uptake outer membrane protein [Bacteroidales bacterium]
MKKILYPIISLIAALSLYSCTDWLELESLTKVSESTLTSSEGGIMQLVAKMYNITPMEDFRYRPNSGYHRYDWDGGAGDMQMVDMYTQYSCRSDGFGINFTTNHWSTYYENIRQVNLFLETIAKAEGDGVISADAAKRYSAEGYFTRAYIYLSLARRYGGVPIIDRVQDGDYIPGGDGSELIIDRSTEKATWEFILSDCDKAAAGLPESVGDYRATKWAALALKARAALYAASIAKYSGKYTMTGEAVTKNLVSMSTSDANAFYQECISACEQIINNSGKKLAGGKQTDPAKAAELYQNIFMHPESAGDEVIFSRAYLDGTVLWGQGHCMDIYFSPAQKNPGFHKYARWSVTSELVDLYEDYTDDGTGKSAPIKTRTDGNETAVFHNVNANENVATTDFIKYDNVTDPFKDKDARLRASVIIPGSTYAGQLITIQGGMFKTDGNPYIYQKTSETVGDVTYYSYGGESKAIDYSGFDGAGGDSDNCSITTTGFSIRKFLSEGNMPAGIQASSTTTWIDMRLAEVYLNYAEAVVESGSGDKTKAAQYLNDIRHRAAHKDNIPLTLENVLKERKVELFGEGQLYWDNFRRRDMHELWSSSSRHGIMPLLDLRSGSPKYVFVRINQKNDETSPRTFDQTSYYLSIPGRNVNKLVDNPGY